MSAAKNDETMERADRMLIRVWHMWTYVDMYVYLHDDRRILAENLLGTAAETMNIPCTRHKNAPHKQRKLFNYTQAWLQNIL